MIGTTLLTVLGTVKVVTVLTRLPGDRHGLVGIAQQNVEIHIIRKNAYANAGRKRK